ncbi:phage tail spike protein [Frisingicoccus sp.]|uniref:phage tail spike protein n=1 Tax=Frisingicoccus sp. TaxID=1918627 RepID=UPI0039920A35
MIQVYNSDNTNYEKNGDMTLFPTSSKVHVILNSTWEATLIHPIDDEGRWKYIQDQAVVKMPSFNGDQLFRIKTKNKTDSTIEAKLEPIFMDARDDCFLMDVRPTEKTGQQALDIMTAANSKYKGSSNIPEISTAYYVTKNLIEAINGDDDNAFVKRWGGEIIFDNFKVIINQKTGRDNGLELLYGKNIKQDGISEEVDFSDVVTRIVPKSYNGYMMSGSMPWVDSPIIKNYPTVKTRTMTFEDVKMRADAQDGDGENGVTICDTQEQLNVALEKKCNDQFEAGLDKPKVTLTIDMVMLQNTDAYKDYADLESVALGDTVHCRHSKLGISTDARVIELEYDAILKKVDYVVLGDFKYSYFDNVTSLMERVDAAIRSDGTVIGEQIYGIINGVKAMMRAQATAAQPAAVRATIFEDLNPNSPTYGALCLGTMGFQIAYERTADGREWDWRTFGTGKGFFADFIVAGTMLCDRIRGGTLKLGGLDNIDGLLQLVDAKDVEIGRWDKDGITITKGSIRSSDFIEGESGIEINLDASTMTSYKKDASGNRSKCVFSDGGMTITNLDNANEKISIRFEKSGDSYIPIISGFSGGHGFSMNHNALIYMIGTVFKSSIGVSGDKGYVATDELTVREAVKTGGGQGITQRIDLPGNAFLQFQSGICVGGGSAVDGKTGRAEFSDNSWMHFTDGIIDGGHTTEGGNL